MQTLSSIHHKVTDYLAETTEYRDKVKLKASVMSYPAGQSLP